jgi:hypothetical protein
MGLPHVHYRLYALLFACLCLGILLAACGTGAVAGTTAAPSPTNTSNAPTPTTVPASGPGATATANEMSLIKQVTFVGTPTAKIVSGTTFAVSGKLKNGDDKQHDIYIQAMLLDASGKDIATTAPFNVDNVPGGATVSFTVQGTTPQPTWTSVKVTVVKVSENVNGAGAD